MRLILILLTALSFPAFGQVYKWTDAQGNVHFGSQPPPGERDQVEVRKSAPGDMGSKSASTTSSQKQPEQSAGYDPIESGAKALSDARRLANERACKLAKHELQSSERLLTLAQSMDSYQFVLDRRMKKVKHWKGRVALHCQKPE